MATVRFIAHRNGWEIQNVEAQLSQTVKRGEGGKLAATVNIAISIEGDLSEEQTNELLKQADACYVHRMIKGEWTIEKATFLKETVSI